MKLFWDCSLVSSSDGFTLQELLFVAWSFSYCRWNCKFVQYKFWCFWEPFCRSVRIWLCNSLVEVAQSVKSKRILMLKSCQTSRGILFPHPVTLLLTEKCKDLGYASLKKYIHTYKKMHFFPRKFALFPEVQFILLFPTLIWTEFIL